jgi:hypothetical protein
MKIEKSVIQTQRVKTCSDKRVSFFFDELDKCLKLGYSPRESLERAAESYAEVFHYVKGSK